MEFKSLSKEQKELLKGVSTYTLCENFTSASNFGGDRAADDFEQGMAFVLENQGKPIWRFESEGSNAGLEPHTHYFAGTEAELTQALQDLEGQINEYEGEEEDVF